MLQMKQHLQPGKLITLCGLDGCGKTTMITMLKGYLKSLGYSVMLTKQPTDLIRGNQVFRAFMDTPNNARYEYRALSLLAASDRVQHANCDILKWLKQGYVVISDRYFYSCLANLRSRGYTEDKWIYEISSFIPKPDIAFFLDLNVDAAIARVRSRPEEKDSYIDIPLQHRLRREYTDICLKNNGHLIDSHGKSEVTFKMILDLINSYMVNDICLRLSE